MITKAQRIYFMADLWPKACAAQGWKKSDNAKRYEIFAQVLGGRPRHARTLAAGRHISLNDFDQADFDAIKAHLQMLTGNLRGAIETEHPEHGHRRRLEWKANDYIQKLAATFDNMDCALRSSTAGDGALDRGAAAKSAAYLRRLLNDRFGASDLSQLTDRDLKQLLATLAARIAARRKSAVPGSGPPPSVEQTLDTELTPF